MEKKYIIEQLNDILNVNKDLTPLQKNALREAINKYDKVISTESVIEVIKLLASILLMSHHST